MKSLTRAIDRSALDPGIVQEFCRRTFESIHVGYVTEIDKIQIACFDREGECRLCVRYQWKAKDRWHYEIVPGSLYREPEYDA